MTNITALASSFDRLLPTALGFENAFAALETDEDTREYLVKGIAGRKFARQFVLSDTVVVRDANLADGILSIELENVIPEEQKPRKITIK